MASYDTPQQNHDWSRMMVSLDPWSLVMSFSRCWGINSGNFLIDNLLSFEDIFICEKKFSSGHCLRNFENNILISSPSAPSDAGWGSDLYSADKLSVLGHFLTHRTWTSWICSALKLSLTVFLQELIKYGPPQFGPASWSAAWVALLWMIYDNPSFRESLEGPIHKYFADFQFLRGSKNFGIKFIHLMKGYDCWMVFRITPHPTWNFRDHIFSSTAQLTIKPS